jgi:hypothetical protein
VITSADAAVPAATPKIPAPRQPLPRRIARSDQSTIAADEATTYTFAKLWAVAALGARGERVVPIRELFDHVREYRRLCVADGMPDAPERMDAIFHALVMPGVRAAVGGAGGAAGGS